MKSISKLAFAIFFTRVSISVSVTRYLRDEQLQSGVVTVFNCKALSRIIDGPTGLAVKVLTGPRKWSKEVLSLSMGWSSEPATRAFTDHEPQPGLRHVKSNQR